MRNRLPAALALLLALVPIAGAPPSAAEAPPPRASGPREVRIEVQDWSTGDTLARLEPGGTLALDPGQRVQVRVTLRRGGDGEEGAPVAALFSLPPGEDGLALSWIDAATGTARLEAVARPLVPPAPPEKAAAPGDGGAVGPAPAEEDPAAAPGNAAEGPTFEVRFRLLDTASLDPGTAAEGSFTVEVTAPAPPTSPAELVTLLYRGILLREPGPYQGILDRDPVPGSSRARIEDVRRRGFSALVEQARELASGEESRKLAEDTQPEERLAALYTHLLGIARDEVDPREWEARLERLRGEGVEPVVESLLRSDAFARRHHLGPWGTAAGGGELAASTPAREMLGLLYRGILLRAPDAGGTRRRLQDIQRRGLPGVLEHGRRIAGSAESREHLYGQGVSYEARLTALYEHLLGLAPEEVEAREWKAELERLRAGDVVEVVEAMLRSETFARRHHLEPGQPGQDGEGDPEESFEELPPP